MSRITPSPNQRNGNERVRFSARWLLCACVLTSLLPTAAHAQQNRTSGPPLAERSLDEVMGAIAERYRKVLTGSPSRSGPRAELPTFVMTEKALSYLNKDYRSTAFRVINESQLVQEQRAVFMLVSQIGLSGTDLLVDYDIPNTASFGSLRLTLDGDRIKVQQEESFRSSSGSRATYARLYSGVTCRDNTEMAWRMNFYNRDRESGICPEPVISPPLPAQIFTK